MRASATSHRPLFANRRLLQRSVLLPVPARRAAVAQQTLQAQRLPDVPAAEPELL